MFSCTGDSGVFVAKTGSPFIPRVMLRRSMVKALRRTCCTPITAGGETSLIILTILGELVRTMLTGNMLASTAESLMSVKEELSFVLSMSVVKRTSLWTP